jgi:acyl-CoA reductase-like NAD-dependent aldehyde dehydrogenase
MAPAAEPLTDFADDRNRREMAHTIAALVESLGDAYPLWIGGERIERIARPGAATGHPRSDADQRPGAAGHGPDADAVIASTDPASPSVVVARFPRAGEEDARRAATAAASAESAWGGAPPVARAAVLERTADALHHRRLEIAAWLCFEAGMPWRIADADAAAAVAHLRAAAHVLREASARSSPRGPGDVVGCVVGGACVLLEPTGTPLGDLAALLAPALAAGRSVCLVPARATPLAAWKLVDALHDAGVAPGAVNLLAFDDAHDGPMSAALRALVCAPEVALVCGAAVRSTDAAVGALVASGRWWHERGAGVSLVAADTDVSRSADDAVDAAIFDAGQSRLACPVAIVDDAVYEAARAHVVERCAALVVGAAIDFTTDVGPLRGAAALADEGRAAQPDVPAGGGHWSVPRVLDDPAPDTVRPLLERPAGAPVLALVRASRFVLGGRVESLVLDRPLFANVRDGAPAAAGGVEGLGGVGGVGALCPPDAPRHSGAPARDPAPLLLARRGVCAATPPRLPDPSDPFGPF